MNKTGKIALLIVSIAVALTVGGFLFASVLWNSTFNFMSANEIAVYDSPDGENSFVFEQMGDPEWPFGTTDVRLTLKDRNGKLIERISTQIHDDGANASDQNIVSVSWNDDAVVVILYGSEMQDAEVIIPYNS